MAKAIADRKAVDSLLKSLLLLSRSIEEVLDTRAVVAACGDPLSPSKVRLLKLVSHRGKQTVGQTARFLGVSDPAASQLADALVRQKLILRNTDPNDRRTAYLRLTAMGQKLVQAIEREQRHRVRLALTSKTDAKPAVWNSFLREVTQLLTRAEKEFDGFCLQCGAHEDHNCVLEGGFADCRYTARTLRQADKAKARKSAAKKTTGKTKRKTRRTIQAL